MQIMIAPEPGRFALRSIMKTSGAGVQITINCIAEFPYSLRARGQKRLNPSLKRRVQLAEAAQGHAGGDSTDFNAKSGKYVSRSFFKIH